MKQSFLLPAIACTVLLLSNCKQDDVQMDAQAEQQLSSQNSGQTLALASTFSNPVITASLDPKDPEVFKGDGKFWLVHPGAANDQAYTLYSSTNLVDWTLETTDCFSISNGNLWSAGSFQYTDASSVKHYNIYYTRVDPSNSRKRTIGVASSTSPQGPYVRISNPDLLTKVNASGVYTPVIDPSVFKDPVSGNVYMYYAQGVGDPGNPTLRCVRLTSDGLNLVAGTDQQVLTITQDWENINIEHPLVYYAPNAGPSRRYYMLYNGSGGALARYSIGYAYSSSPTGPFTKAPEGTGTGQNPIVKQNPSQGIYGPGAPNTVVDDAGIRWLIYRIKTTAGESWGNRAICVDELFRNGSDQLICTPTKGTSQAAPTF
jgi:beta-xylosidase